VPIHIDEMTTEVDAFEGELPLSQPQLERLIELVLSRIEDKQRERGRMQESTQIRTGAITR
jgi:hypothetical protein